MLTVKKSVIRFRPADIAAEESEQNRHRADKLVPDVYRSANHGGVGAASLQKSSCRSDYAHVSPLDAGVPVSVPSRITCERFPTTACRRWVWFNWALQLHSSLTRSQLHGHCKSCEKETHRQKGSEEDCRQEGRQEGRQKGNRQEGSEEDCCQEDCKEGSRQEGSEEDCEEGNQEDCRQEGSEEDCKEGDQEDCRQEGSEEDRQESRQEDRQKGSSEEGDQEVRHQEDRCQEAGREEGRQEEAGRSQEEGRSGRAARNPGTADLNLVIPDRRKHRALSPTPSGEGAFLCAWHWRGQCCAERRSPAGGVGFIIEATWLIPSSRRCGAHGMPAASADAAARWFDSSEQAQTTAPMLWRDGKRR
ncbi:AAA ATPase containing von Willebrand factor type A (vWA) domain [Xanthomonas oryzae pv. oryzae KACC 10331]|uniref:AAA ATPase containing von Willebrand factor type A (VWA) domain n=1 Tax=Xanthomonas oryzae pv. oryzae (strain KACC10331 / KXO85) TaxID=291331 RepID=Q5H1X1_XANOR|nr:AAA ATPase containing von Willebrand factor type A (vWA) domain [Xanthomonas oryzae pv. oryzae KACC 10331]